MKIKLFLKPFIVLMTAKTYETLFMYYLGEIQTEGGRERVINEVATTERGERKID